MAVCKGCGKVIKWVVTPAGNKMPVDPDWITIVTEKGEVVAGRIPHWATCPQAATFKRARKEITGRQAQG